MIASLSPSRCAAPAFDAVTPDRRHVIIGETRRDLDRRVRPAPAFRSREPLEVDGHAAAVSQIVTAVACTRARYSRTAHADDTFDNGPGRASVSCSIPGRPIIGGVRAEIWRRSLHAWTDDRYIYILMEPAGYGFQGARRRMRGEITVMPSSWVARLDPNSWEVLQEYPHPGHRANWICFDHDGSHMYVPSTSTHTVSKISIETGEIAWTRPDGRRSVRLQLNPTVRKSGLPDKGEATQWLAENRDGVRDPRPGNHLDTLSRPSRVTIFLLSPTANEFWATSKLRRCDLRLRRAHAGRKDVIQIPGGGDLHASSGHYDENGEPGVVRDRRPSTNGIDPGNGRAFDENGGAGLATKANRPGVRY